MAVEEVPDPAHRLYRGQKRVLSLLEDVVHRESHTRGLAVRTVMDLGVVFSVKDLEVGSRV